MIRPDKPELVAYLRERCRLIQLAQILDAKQKTLNYGAVIAKCWDMLKSMEWQQMMLYDNDDVLVSNRIKGDTHRSQSLDLMSRKFCFEVLIILFFALSE